MILSDHLRGCHAAAVSKALERYAFVPSAKDMQAPCRVVIVFLGLSWGCTGCHGD